MKFLTIGVIALLLVTSCQDSPTNTENKKTNRTSSQMSPTFLHEQTYGQLNVSTEQEWDSIRGISSQIVPQKKKATRTQYKTFGWHLHSNGTAYKNYNFSMLWGISYFSYNIVPETGSYKSIHQWKTTALIDSAKAHDCKVFLTVCNFGANNNAQFLSKPKAQQTLIDSLIHLLSIRNADGINIDFEGVSPKSKNKLTKFISNISQQLKRVNKNYMISLCLYAIDEHNIFDIKKLNPHVDFYTLMAYDYYGGFSNIAGPVSPLKSSKLFGRGVEFSVQQYLDKGLSPQNLILGLPYYGAEWRTESKTIPSKVEHFKSHLQYKNIKKVYIDSLSIPVLFDKKTATSYMITNQQKGHYQQIWFENKQSLAFKYDWVKNNNIGGVGIWALGYDNGYSDLWTLIDEKFCAK